MAAELNRPQVADKAPDFVGTNNLGESVSLGDYAGKKLILYFYPKDNTPGCTSEACSLRDGRTELLENGFEVLGVSPDSVASHQKFIDKQSLNFNLLSDPDHQIAQAYGAWGEKKFMGRTYDGILRTTFVIDENGFIERVFDKVKTKDHFNQILDTYKNQE
ncbi:MAG: thioredoxin-dependent thiol peroxidase [Rikenellaceae bacterium]